MMISPGKELMLAGAMCMALVGQAVSAASTPQDNQDPQRHKTDDPAPARSHASRPAATSKPALVRIVLVGDSTVTDKSGWGGRLSEFFIEGVEIINTSSGGKSTRSFRDKGLWAQAMELKGDYVFIQFGHNDNPGKGPERETNPNTTYRQNLERFIDDVRQGGGQPILVTPMSRRRFESDGKIRPTLKPYAQAVRAVAADKHVPFIELYNHSIELFEKMGEKATDQLGGKDGTDHTHFNDKGNRLWCGMIAEQIPAAVPALARFLKPADQRPKVTLEAGK
jgi:lysophospholipase L1-like esterase